MIRSLLFVPGTRPDRFAGAAAAGADLACIDLEDAVPTDGKDAARSAALAAGPDFALRVNGVATRAGLADLLALAEAGHRPPLLLVPMVESPRDLAIVSAVLGDVALVPLIETAAGLRKAHAISRAPNVAAVMLGGADLAADLGVALAWEPLLGARQALVLACAGVPLIDVPHVRLEDEAGLADEARRVRLLGFSGKAAIHPRQVPAINAALAPAAAALAEARDALAAFRAAGGAAIRFNGRLLEKPIVDSYRRTLAAAGEPVDA